MKCQPRIVVAGPTPPPSGGMAMQTQLLTECLTNSGVPVTLVATNPVLSPGWLDRARFIRAPFRFALFASRLLAACMDAKVLHIMANSGWSWHLIAAPAIVLGRLAGVRVVVNYRGGGAERFFERSFSWVRQTLRLAHAIIVPSEYLQTTFRRYGVEVALVPNILDTKLFSPAAGSDRDACNQEFAILLPRNLERIYGADIAIGAMPGVLESVPHARLLLAGDGPEREMLEAQCARLGIADRVTFLGHQTREQMVEWYRRSDVVINPSRVDNSPNAVLEAMACGKAIIATNVGNVPLMLEHGAAGQLFDVADNAGLVCALLRLHSDAALKKQIEGRALNAVTKYEWQQVRSVLFAAYQIIGLTGNASDRARKWSQCV